MAALSESRQGKRRRVLHRFVPGLGRANVAREVLAGVTLIALSVPLNIGYAQIAGLPPTAGLYALVLPSVVFALTASSRQLVVAPDAAAAALVSSSLVGLAVAGSTDYATMAAAQAILSGVVLIVAGRLKLGFLADFLSHPILVGFVGGLALEVMVSQVAKMLGIAVDSGADFWTKTAELLAGLPSAHPASVLLSVAALIVLLSGRWWAPGVPWALLVMVAATAASVLLRFQDAGVAVLGEVPSGPPRLAFPSLAPGQWIALVPSALALSAVVLAEGLLVGRSYAEKHGYPHQPDRDLAAAGLANLAAGVSGSFNVGSSTSRTAAMDAAGSRTQLPSVVLAAGSLLLLLFGTRLLEAVPAPVIGAIVAAAVFRLLGISELVSLWGQSRTEYGVAAACMLGVLVLGPIRGLLVAFVLALVNLARQASAPPLEVLADPDSAEESVLAVSADGRETVPGVVVFRVVAPIFFANANTVEKRILHVVGSALHPVRWVVLDLEGVSGIDVTAAARLRSALAGLAGSGIGVATARVRPELRAQLAHADLLTGAVEYPTNRAALAALRGSAGSAPPRADG
ncbi:MAG: STAS domain-containing protein [Cellulomonas sp.]|nr:STAS domain-containing protein [Cellulomonas sp.]